MENKKEKTKMKTTKQGGIVSKICRKMNEGNVK